MCSSKLLPRASVSRPECRYRLGELYKLLSMNGKLWPSDTVFNDIKSLGLLRYRGRRGGSNLQRRIPTIVSSRVTSRPTDCYFNHDLRRTSFSPSRSLLPSHTRAINNVN